MKKTALLSGFIFLMVSVAYADVAFQSVFNSSGSTLATIGDNSSIMSAQSGRRVAISKLYANSDLASAIITIKAGATTGATDNYTTVGTIATDGSGDFEYDKDFPLYVGAANTQIQITLDSTTANSLIVGWERL